MVPSHFLLGEQHLGHGVLLRHTWELWNFIFTVSLELDCNYTSLVVENFIGNPFEDRGWKPGFAEGKRNFCCWSQAGSRVASLVCPWSKTLRSATLPGVSESMAFVRLRHVSWQHNDLEPNFWDAEPPLLSPCNLHSGQWSWESNPSKWAAYQMRVRRRLTTCRSLLGVSLAL